MFSTVEKADTRDAMKVGIGTEEQVAALKIAGAEKVFDLSDLKFFIKHPGHLVRDGDTLVMAQPNLIKKSDMRVILSASGPEGILCVVPGHDPMTCDTEAKLSAFRQLKPADVSVPIAANLGRPSKIEYTLQQADAIIRAWHQPRPNKLSLIEVTREAERLLGLEPEALKSHWVRDLVRKFVGTAQRDKPDGWTGISTEIDKEGE